MKRFSCLNFFRFFSKQPNKIPGCHNKINIPNEKYHEQKWAMCLELSYSSTAINETEDNCLPVEQNLRRQERYQQSFAVPLILDVEGTASNKPN